MIYTTCLMAYASFSYARSKQFRLILGVSLVALCFFITIYYHYLQDPVFHQNVYALLTTIIVFRSMFIMEYTLRPSLRKSEEKHRLERQEISLNVLSKDAQHLENERDKDILKNMWILVAFGLTVFLGGFAMWGLDIVYCSTWRKWRRGLGLPWGILLEGHGWWYITRTCSNALIDHAADTVQASHDRAWRLLLHRLGYLASSYAEWSTGRLCARMAQNISTTGDCADRAARWRERVASKWPQQEDELSLSGCSWPCCATIASQSILHVAQTAIETLSLFVVDLRALHVSSDLVHSYESIRSPFLGAVQQGQATLGSSVSLALEAQPGNASVLDRMHHYFEAVYFESKVLIITLPLSVVHFTLLTLNVSPKHSVIPSHTGQDAVALAKDLNKRVGECAVIDDDISPVDANMRSDSVCNHTWSDRTIDYIFRRCSIRGWRDQRARRNIASNREATSIHVRHSVGQEHRQSRDATGLTQEVVSPYGFQYCKSWATSQPPQARIPELHRESILHEATDRRRKGKPGYLGGVLFMILLGCGFVVGFVLMGVSFR